MIESEKELEATLERIQYFQRQVAKIREAEKDPESYRHSSSGYLAEIDRMNLEVREYLSIFPGEIKESA